MKNLEDEILVNLPFFLENSNMIFVFRLESRILNGIMLRVDHENIKFFISKEGISCEAEHNDIKLTQKQKLTIYNYLFSKYLENGQEAILKVIFMVTDKENFK